LILLQKSGTMRIGVVSDTHVPDRVRQLHPRLLESLTAEKVDFLFHAGDVSRARVIRELEQVAPVYCVSGNRDFLSGEKYPRRLDFLINGIEVTLTHGHIDPWHYWVDKSQNFLHHYRVDRYVNRLPAIAPTAKVIVFGHSHHAENLVREGRIFFNPGSCSVAEKPDFQLSFGIIEIHPDGRIVGKIQPLLGWGCRSGKWIEGERN